MIRAGSYLAQFYNKTLGNSEKQILVLMDWYPEIDQVYAELSIR